MTSAHTDKQLRLEASEWFARLRASAVSPEIEAEFFRWAAQSPRHAAAYEAVCAAWDVLGMVPAKRRPRHAMIGRREFAGGAIAASLAAYFLLRAEPAEAKVFKTAIGEQKRFTLPDGSALLLDTASEVSASCDKISRTASLGCGRAHFDVTNARESALVVRIGDISVTSHRGHFDVFRGEDAIFVYLQQNDAAVQTANGDNVKLRPGDYLRAPMPYGKLVIDRPAQEAITAWQRGILVFDQTTLSDAVREMNRYSPVKLTISDAKAAQLKISGAYGAGKAAEFLHTLTLLLPVRAQARGDGFEITSTL
ncbi:transmembrane sensor [Rhizomicrobium palustre]|uniref:Transmembrane sensor n=1 Tax=Rhizomicrobium palustre TaxID=189966 RepID=A0A846MV73_9PROT|nr:DUF4880 domain-containing protein [Rhizomicrobium palustre]NIK87125.1 transmembrane sensor [Rhizomicrobium palustre]